MVVALPRVFLHRVSVVVPCHHSGFAVGHDDGQSSAELEVGASIPRVSSRQLEVVHQSGRWFLITAGDVVFEERLLLNVLLTCRFACAKAASRVSSGNQPVAVLGIIGQEIKLLTFRLFLCLL